MATKYFTLGDSVVITKDAEMFFGASRANVIHEVTDVVRGGYRIAPINGEGVDFSRSVCCLFDEVREVQS